ncbi:MAG TPA: YceI family protein, partial [Burkholderiales bacterium]|nr:YceI family protein [Burkholderiales bacterium]
EIEIVNPRIYVCSLLVTMLFARPAMAADWRMDPGGSRLEFSASYQGEPAPGRFKQFDTRMNFDPARLGKSELIVTVKLSSVDMGSAEIDEAVRAPEWLNLSKFTRAEFRSTDIKRAATDRYVARGTLNLKGRQRPLDVPFSWKPDGKAATMMGEVTLDRTAFGIGTGEWATGDPIGVGVKISFNVRLQPAS